MALQRLTCHTIGDLDEGRAAGIINAALAQLYRDIEDRGHDEKPRSLQITLTFSTSKGLVVTDVAAKIGVPAYRTNLTAAKVGAVSKDNPEPMLYFQQHNSEDPDQATFPEMDQE